MDQVIKSNNSSVIYRSLQDTKVQDLSYSTKPSFPILAKEYRETNPNQQPSGSPHGQEIAFKILQSDLWAGCTIKNDYVIASTYSATTSNSHLHGIQMYEWIQIRSNNRVLFQFSDYYLRARLDQENEAKSSIIRRMAMPLARTTEVPVDLAAGVSTVSATTYTHLDCSFFETVRNHVDLHFYEQLEVVCKYNTQARAGMERAISSTVATIWNWKYKLDDIAYQRLRSQNQRPDVPLNMYTYSTFTERVECTSTTQNSIRLNVNGPCINTYIMVMDKTATVAVGGQPFKIDSFDFTVGGTKLLESVPDLVGKKEACLAGSSAIGVPTATTLSRIDNNVICINWGMNTRDRTYNSGGCSFSQINFPKITVNTQTLGTAANYDLVVVHEVAQICTFQNSNGSISITTSS